MITIAPLALPAGDAAIDALAAVLIDCVDGGASVSFMQPLAHDKARAFFRASADAAARGERIVFVAADDEGGVVGTVQLILAQPENQPHRGDVAKMLVHRGARRRGVGALLMRAAESAAIAHRKTLLVLDTASPDAERLYTRLGWERVGRIPNYALLPDGAPCDTTYFFKELPAAAAGS
jgi:GNAT superfamily N-acetyltransferase